MFIDELRSRKGRWRPSADAKRLGTAAEKIEELIYRDDHSFDEACQIIQSNPSSLHSKDELYEIYLKLPKTGHTLTLRQQYISERGLKERGLPEWVLTSLSEIDKVSSDGVKDIKDFKRLHRLLDELQQGFLMEL